VESVFTLATQRRALEFAMSTLKAIEANRMFRCFQRQNGSPHQRLRDALIARTGPAEVGNQKQAYRDWTDFLLKADAHLTAFVEVNLQH